MNLYKGRMKELGEFELTTPKLRVSDPCYTPDVWCSGVLDAKPGTWDAAMLVFTNEETQGWGERVAILAVKHSDMKQQFDTEIINRTKEIVKPAGWSTALFEVGVDSGQAGFFDDTIFAAHNGGHDEAFYDKACDITLSNEKAGVMPNGVVSSSGYGDGGYECIYHYDDQSGLVDFAYIIFIGVEDEDDEGEED